MQNMLIIILYTLIIGLLSIVLYQNTPYVIQYLKRIIPRKKRVLNVDCSLLEQRVNELEKKVAKRANNDRAAIRQEIKNVLIELKKYLTSRNELRKNHHTTANSGTHIRESSYPDVPNFYPNPSKFITKNPKIQIKKTKRLKYLL